MDELRIKKILKQKGLTMYELSKMLEMDQSNLTKSLKGNFRIGLIRKIADVLGVQLREMIDFDEVCLTDVTGFLETQDLVIHKINNFQDLENIYLKLCQTRKSTEF